MLMKTTDVCPVQANYRVAPHSHLLTLSVTMNWTALLDGDPTTCATIPANYIHNLLIRVYMPVSRNSPFLFTVIGRSLLCSPVYMNIYFDVCTGGNTACESALCLGIPSQSNDICRFRCEPSYPTDKVYVQISDWMKPNSPQLCRLY